MKCPICNQFFQLLVSSKCPNGCEDSYLTREQAEEFKEKMGVPPSVMKGHVAEQVWEDEEVECRGFQDPENNGPHTLRTFISPSSKPPCTDRQKEQVKGKGYSEPTTIGNFTFFPSFLFTLEWKEFEWDEDWPGIGMIPAKAEYNGLIFIRSEFPDGVQIDMWQEGQLKEKPLAMFVLRKEQDIG